jgi:two-component system chemotaxis response regulator CheY
MSQPKTVFLMDDSEIIVSVVSASLSARGYRVFAATNLAELEASCAATMPDLVVLDVQMPEAFGDDIGQVLKRVRKMTAPVLLFSSLDEAVLAERVKDAELDGYVCKSAGVEALVERIESIVPA